MSHPANLAAAAASKTAIGSPGACPLRQTHVQLMPLRYGLVEKPLDPSAELKLPYALTTRPLGIRLLRDGWLYVIDSVTGHLHEYQVLNGLVSALLHKGAKVAGDQRTPIEERPALVFSRRSTLHVTFAEVQWTAAKCTQVLDSREEREHFMQAVDLGPVHCQTGGEHLLTVAQGKQWLAEIATDPARQAQTAQDRAEQEAESPSDAVLLPTVHVSDAPAHEREPYLWEQPRRFREAHIGEFLGRVRPAYQDDTLFLVVQDDLGVLRDLAEYQDTVVGWVDDWSNADNNERDYLLASYIESLSQLSPADVGNLADASDDPRVQALFGDLEQLPEPDREQTRKALLDYLNKGGKVEPVDVPAPPELVQLRKEAQAEVQEMLKYQGGNPDITAHRRAIDDADRSYYTRQHFARAPTDFVEQHLKTLIKLGKEQNKRIIDVLEGSSFSGKRGVNDFIDRPAMDAALFQHRDDLGRWNRLLERITADRTMLVNAGHFHRSAWYYDAQDQQQLHQAFAAEYACLKDICRSDHASEILLGYLEKHPELTRPLFYTLPLRLQPERAAQYTTLFNAGMGVFNNLPHWLGELKKIEQPHLPALDDLPEHTRAVADAAQHSLSPALNLGLSRALEGFDLAGGKIPDLDELFRRLPKALSGRILDAAKTTGVTFTVASPAEHAALQTNLKELLSERDYLRTLTRERNLFTHNKNRAGHKTPRAVELQGEIVRVRGQLTQLEGRLAGALSPIAELPDQSVRLYGATPARAGVTVVFPPAQQLEVRSLLKDIRLGVQGVPNTKLIRSEGMGLLVFLVQGVNLVSVYREMMNQTKNPKKRAEFFAAFAATGAAGFTAAQSLADTALKARSTELVAGLQHHALQNVQVQMGKMHVGLGFFTYLFGFVSSLSSFNSQQQKWQQATRTGDRSAQTSAALATLGAGGMTAANAYGFGHTLHAGYTVAIARNAAARTAAWAAAGTRLSTVFFRFNLAGALFTILELGGTWLYNRYNISAHDKWLKTTPWSLDTDHRGDHTLDEYQRYLAYLLNAPYAQLGPNEHDSWLKNLLLKARPSDIHLVLPRLKLNDLQPPLSGQPAHRLGIGAHRLSVPLHNRGVPRERKDVISEEVVNSLRIVQTGPDRLVLCLQYPLDLDAEFTPASETLELAVCIQTLNAKGVWESLTDVIHLNPRGRDHFPALPRQSVTEHPPLLLVETHLLELADHAHQD
ncbi:toxin VasX [Pseudomonas sp. Irchel 3H3]|uniref:toxin VasX n=1 Tax=Pseudomonas sp. Irchel 3H3 TaxID=2009038 RepID=UPI000BA34AC7